MGGGEENCKPRCSELTGRVHGGGSRVLFMNVRVKLFATLQDHGAGSQDLEVEENAVLRDVIEKLDLPEDIPLIAIVNGRHAGFDHRLRDGDEIALFPPIAGG